MGWETIELNGQSEFDAIRDFITDDENTYVIHNYNPEEGVYYFALNYKGEVTATIVSMNSFKGYREEGWIYFKVIHEFAGPIYISPSTEVYEALTTVNKDSRYNWRKKVQNYIK